MPDPVAAKRYLDLRSGVAAAARVGRASAADRLREHRRLSRARSGRGRPRRPTTTRARRTRRATSRAAAHSRCASAGRSRSARACCRARPSATIRSPPRSSTSRRHSPIRFRSTRARRWAERGFTEIGTTARMSLGARKFLAPARGLRPAHALHARLLRAANRRERLPVRARHRREESRLSRRRARADRCVDRQQDVAAPIRELRAVELARVHAEHHRLQEPAPDDGGRHVLVLGAIAVVVLSKADRRRSSLSTAMPRTTAIGFDHTVPRAQRRRSVGVGADRVRSTAHEQKSRKPVDRQAPATPRVSAYPAHGAAPAAPEARREALDRRGSRLKLCTNCHAEAALVAPYTGTLAVPYPAVSDLKSADFNLVIGHAKQHRDAPCTVSATIDRDEEAAGATHAVACAAKCHDGEGRRRSR